MNMIRGRVNTFHTRGLFEKGILRCKVSYPAVESNIVQCSGIFFLCYISNGRGASCYEANGSSFALAGRDIPWSPNCEYK